MFLSWVLSPKLESPVKPVGNVLMPPPTNLIPLLEVLLDKLSHDWHQMKWISLERIETDAVTSRPRSGVPWERDCCKWKRFCQLDVGYPLGTARPQSGGGGGVILGGACGGRVRGWGQVGGSSVWITPRFTALCTQVWTSHVSVAAGPGHDPHSCSSPW